MNNKITYIIYSPDYENSIGGSLALHSLSENLSLLGEEVYITCEKKKKKFFSKVNKH